MNLYLSSYRLGNHADVLQQMAGDNKRVAVINNAMDYKSAADRELGNKRELDDMAALGFVPDEIDLRDYFDQPAATSAKLGEFGIVWARGGNSFLLRQAMERSGFDKALASRLYVDPSFVYAGYSAGIVAITPTLEGIELVDDAHVHPEPYSLETTWRGVGILDYSIAPHFQSDHPESAAIDLVVEYFKAHDMPYKTLRDGEVIVVQDGKETLLR